MSVELVLQVIALLGALLCVAVAWRALKKIKRIDTIARRKSQAQARRGGEPEDPLARAG